MKKRGPGESTQRVGSVVTDDGTLYFYSHTSGAHRCFSQFYECYFCDPEDGTTYCCAEQFMMAGKAKVMGDAHTLDCIVQCGYNPSAIKKLGRAVTPWDEEKWVAARLDIVARGNYLKFSQNPELRKTLRSTSGLTLVEAAGNDKIWGIGRNLRDAAAGAKWDGLNLLGHALMQTREALGPEPIGATSGKSKSSSVNDFESRSRNEPKLEVSADLKGNDFDFFAVLDFEATCEKNCSKWVNEIIEFPTVILDATTMQQVDEFQAYCKPRLNEILTPFCTQLTGIEQKTVDDGQDFVDVFEAWSKFMTQYPNSLIITCGDWDLKVMLPLQLSQSSHTEHADKLRRLTTAKKLTSKWCNIKVIFGEAMKLKKARGMVGMLQHCSLELKGRHHSGIDDCRNISQIVSFIGRKYGKAAFRVTASFEGSNFVRHVA